MEVGQYDVIPLCLSYLKIFFRPSGSPSEKSSVHFANTGIRVNAIAPGFFSTDQNKTLLWNADGTPTARTHKILAATPMGRFGTPRSCSGRFCGWPTRARRAS